MRVSMAVRVGGNAPFVSFASCRFFCLRMSNLTVAAPRLGWPQRVSTGHPARRCVSARLRRPYTPFDPRRCSQWNTTLTGKVGLQISRFMGTDKERRALGQSWSASHSEQPHWRALIGANMDITTLLIIVVVVLLLGGGGWYGRGRWY
jgi:hypothetical protein